METDLMHTNGVYLNALSRVWNNTVEPDSSKARLFEISLYSKIIWNMLEPDWLWSVIARLTELSLRYYIRTRLRYHIKIILFEVSHSNHIVCGITLAQIV